MATKQQPNGDTSTMNGKGRGNIVLVPSTDSMSMLTRPQLFSIYDEEIVESEDTEIYEEAKKSAGKIVDESVFTAGVTSRKRYKKFFNFVISLSILGISGIAYHELSKNLHDNHLLHEEFTSRPLVLGVKLCQQLSFGLFPTWAGYALEGIIFGSMLPVLDYWRGVKVAKVSLSGVLRSVNAILGVAFGIRRVEWSSSLQASVAWFLLDGVLWLFFDGSLSVLLLGFTMGLITAITSYAEIVDLSQLLYFIDFYFLGLLFFGKLGRFLYQR
ncbi:HBR485Cp [Eremothecium sinecaudum]|uniref:HBR485Cp n=1 Tax=Eremothecium sinecaudum TaxID=45286 RepID=A0A109UVM8_9SACH|nr:HBR485Cp [Eremothecium sinecaudum]AMD19386.1 HBR485Cp [Eremothecium sinecaudum]